MFDTTKAEELNAVVLFCIQNGNAMSAYVYARMLARYAEQCRTL